MMKLINTFKDSLLKIRVVWEMFKMGVLNSGPVKAFAYVWGLDWVLKLLIFFNTMLILISTSSGDWRSAVVIIGITYLAIGYVFYCSKYRELLKLLQKVKPVDTLILEGAAQKSEDGNYYITVDEALVDNTSKDN